MKLSRPIILLFLLTGLSHCGSIPKIIILHDPLSVEEHLQLGRAYEAQQKWDLALSEYKAALKKGGSKTVIAKPIIEGSIGNVYYAKKDYSSAKKSYRSALKKDPENAAILNNLASLYLIQQGNSDEPELEGLKKAEVLVRKAIRIDPTKKAYFLDTLGQIYLARGDAEIALSFFKEAEQTMHSNTPFFAKLIEHKKRATEELEKISSTLDRKK